MKFSIKDFFSKCDQQETADLVTFTEKILNGKLRFLCSDNCADCCLLVRKGLTGIGALFIRFGGWSLSFCYILTVFLRWCNLGRFAEPVANFLVSSSARMFFGGTSVFLPILQFTLTLALHYPFLPSPKERIPM